MEILVFAGVAVAITILVFVMLDKKNKAKSMDEEATAMPKRATDQTLIDYNVYIMKKREYIVYALLSGLVLFVIGYVFYHHLILALLFSGLGLYYPILQKKTLIKKRKQELSNQFQQALFSVSSSLIAGRSIENAFYEVTKDLELLYPDPNTFIIKEFDMINRRVANRETIESALIEFSERAGIDDITNFTDVFTTCKRTGGDLVEVIRRTVTMISEKIEIQQEISVMVAQKKFESKVLSIAPVAMVAFVSYMSGDYMAPLYRLKDGGPIVMTAGLCIVGFSYWISQRIMDIKV